MYIYFCKHCNKEQEFDLEWIKNLLKTGRIQFCLRCKVCHKLLTYTQ